MESHLGFRMTTMLVNEHRREEGNEQVGVTAVMNAFYRLKPKINIIEKVQSGGLKQGWIDASDNIAKQMKIMLGEMTEDEVMTDQTGSNYPYYMQTQTNPCFNRNKYNLQREIYH